MEAYCLIRSMPWYRREAFTNGLAAAGHTVFVRSPVHPNKNTLLVIWNRYAENHHLASAVEAKGGTVLVAENGYIGAGGGAPKFQVHPAGPQAHHYYALARSHHNGGGQWRGEDSARFSALGLTLKPWRTNGEYILVCPNRSFGIPERMMHPDWDRRVVDQIKKHTKLPIRIRPHPGNNAPKRDLSVDLAGARAVVIWSSSCGVHALVDGIPVICQAPYWVCKQGAYSDIAALAGDLPEHPNRTQALSRMAWAQWTIEEINSGEPFRYLLS